MAPYNRTLLNDLLRSEDTKISTKSVRSQHRAIELPPGARRNKIHSSRLATRRPERRPAFYLRRCEGMQGRGRGCSCERPRVPGEGQRGCACREGSPRGAHSSTLDGDSSQRRGCNNTHIRTCRCRPTFIVPVQGESPAIAVSLLLVAAFFSRSFIFPLVNK